METATIRYWWRSRLVTLVLTARDRDGLERKIEGLRELGFHVAQAQFHREGQGELQFA